MQKIVYEFSKSVSPTILIIFQVNPWLLQLLYIYDQRVLQSFLDNFVLKLSCPNTLCNAQRFMYL